MDWNTEQLKDARKIPLLTTTQHFFAGYVRNTNSNRPRQIQIAKSVSRQSYKCLSMSTKAELNMKNVADKSLSHHCFSLAALRTRSDNLIDEGRQNAPVTHAEIGPDCSGLSAQLALDLANCLPFLACGEESAVHAFSHSLLKDISSEEAKEMQAIAKDELRHARYLECLRCELPAPCIHLPVDATSRFFRRLLTKDSAKHFAQIAALDLSVCRLLAPLLHPQAGLRNAPQVSEILGAITRDEARHVKVARKMAFKLGCTPLAFAGINQEIEQQLATLIAPIRASHDRLAKQDQHGVIEPATSQRISLKPANGQIH